MDSMKSMSLVLPHSPWDRMKPHHLANFTGRGGALGTKCAGKSLEVKEFGEEAGWFLQFCSKDFSEHLTDLYKCQDSWDHRGAGQRGLCHISSRGGRAPARILTLSPTSTMHSV